jgi:hypothetical protein
VVPLYAFAILKTRVVPRWIGWLGFVVAVFAGWLGLLSPAVGVIEALPRSASSGSSSSWRAWGSHFCEEARWRRERTALAHGP